MAAPVPFIVFANIRKAIRGIKEHSPGYPSKSSAGRESSAFHFYDCASLVFAVRHLLFGFTEKSIR